MSFQCIHAKTKPFVYGDYTLVNVLIQYITVLEKFYDGD